MQKQLEVGQRLNELLSEALTEIGDAVSGVDPDSVRDQNAAAVLYKVKSAVSKLEKEVAEFNKSMK